MSEERLLAELSADRVWQSVTDIVEQFPSRLAGTEVAWSAAGYLYDQLRAEGIAAELMEYPGLVSFPGEGSLEVISPQPRTIPASVLGHSLSTPPGGIEGDLVDAGRGTWDSCEQVGVAGKIVLSDLSYFPPRQEKQRIMALQGAIGSVLLNWGYDNSDLLPYGSVKPCWGNPTRLTKRTEMPEIPVLGVSRAAGLWLRAMAAQGRVRLRIRAQSSDEWRKLRQAIGWVRSDGTQEFAILGGHMDGWYGQAATDNAAGNALFLEIGRVFQRYADELKRGLAVGFWVGHETGTMVGSTHFVDSHWDDLRENAVAYLQVDQPGIVGTTIWETKSDVELHDYHFEVERRILGEKMESEWKRLTRTGDSSFFGVGVPSISSRSVFTRAEVDAMGNGDLGWWHHTEANTLDKLDKELLGTHLRVYAAYLWGLCTLPILPARFAPAVKLMVQRLEKLIPEADGIDLAGPTRLAKDALEAVERLDSVADSWRERARGREVSGEVQEILNDALKRLSRILVPLGGTVAGVYGHDPYGLSAQSTLLPGLHDLPRMNRLPAGSEERYLLFTELVRQRNRVADAMREVRDLAGRTATAVQV